MTLGALGLVPGVVLQLGDEALRRPQAPELDVATGLDVGAAVPVKDVGPKQLVAVLLPKTPEELLLALPLGARLATEAGQPIS